MRPSRWAQHYGCAKIPYYSYTRGVISFPPAYSFLVFKMAEMKRRPHAGRPKAEIDWDVVDEMLKADMDGVSIAEHFGIAPDTLYIACKKKYNIDFSAYKQAKRACGDDRLKELAYTKAKDDNTLLIFLLKARCGYSDKPNIDTRDYSVVGFHFVEVKGDAQD
jgi:hypothetical protein